MTKTSQSILLNSNLQIIFLITLMAVMGVSSISPAFPTIIKEFDITPGEVGWLITAFTLPGIFMTPFMGIMADRFGRKTVLIPSLMVFGIFGFLCTFMRSFEVLLVLRFFQGVGASSLGSINITLIGDLFSGKDRAEAMGYNSSVLSIGTASYPAIGGALTLAGWNYPFIITILAIPVGMLVLFKLKNPEPKAPRNLKQYLLNTWNNINQPKVWGLFIINILIFVVIYGTILTYLPIHLNHDYQSSSLTIGLVMTVMSISTAITSARIGYFLKLASPRNLLFAGFCTYAISMVIIPFAEGWTLIVLASVLAGCAHGISIPNIQNLLVSMAPLEERAAFMSLNSMVLRIGQTIGPLFMGVFFLLSGTNATFIAAAGLALVMVLITFLVVK